MYSSHGLPGAGRTQQEGRWLTNRNDEFDDPRMRLGCGMAGEMRRRHWQFEIDPGPRGRYSILIVEPSKDGRVPTI
jgi:hypothetical protein